MSPCLLFDFDFLGLSEALLGGEVFSWQFRRLMIKGKCRFGRIFLRTVFVSLVYSKCKKMGRRVHELQLVVTCFDGRPGALGGERGKDVCQALRWNADERLRRQLRKRILAPTLALLSS